MRILAISLATIVLSFLSSGINAQNAPIKFGNVSKAELQMKVYDKDTSAAAVILCDYGFFIPRLPQFVRTIRIKILKKEGYNWANHIFPTSSKANIKGFTFNLKDGKIVNEKLRNSSIYTEQVTEGYFNSRVAMPNVRVGSVIELQFTIAGAPLEWRFQQTIPVVHSEMTIEPYASFRFRKYFYGLEQLDVNDSYHWEANDVPAFRDEPFMNSRENYITKFDFDMYSMTLFYIAPTWDAISFHLSQVYPLGHAFKSSGYLNDIADGIIKTNDTEKEKIAAAYDSIKQIKWDHTQRLFPSNKSLSYAFHKKIGNSADINLALIQLLRKIGLEAYPVVLSTRDNGMLSPYYVSFRKLNHVIVFVKTPKKNYLIDATEEYMPFDLLPLKCLNFSGWLVNDDQSGWVDLKAEKKFKKMIYYKLHLHDDLSLTGDITYTHYDYAAHDFRKSYHSFNGEKEYLNNFKKDKPGLKITNFDLKNIDSLSLPVQDEYTVQINDQVNQIGNEILFNPLFFDRMDDNPFKLEERDIPIDFAYPREMNIIVNIRIPDDYDVSALPGQLQMRLPDNSASFSYQVSILNNMLMLNFKYNIDRQIYTQDEYALLRNFFMKMIAKNSEPVTLIKK